MTKTENQKISISDEYLIKYEDGNSMKKNIIIENGKYLYMHIKLKTSH
jgi:hypothetical protein